MKPQFHLFSVLFLLLLALSCTGLAAQKVYTWTDENGVVHYDDNPPPGGEAEAIQATEAYRPGSVSVQPEADTVAEPAEPSVAQQRRDELAMQREQLNKEMAETERLCSMAHEQLAKLEPSRRVFYENEAGETVRMDDVERVSRVAELKEIIAQNCDS
jgi:hypothetical protein